MRGKLLERLDTNCSHTFCFCDCTLVEEVDAKKKMVRVFDLAVTVRHNEMV